MSVGQLIEGLGELLISGDEVAFEHGSDDGRISCGALADDFFENGGHLGAILAAVGVGGIYHDARSKVVFEKGVASDLDGVGIEVGPVFAAT